MAYFPNASTLPVAWTKATASDPNENCVECARLDDLRLVRDSKDPHGPAHAHAAPLFSAFLAAVAEGTLVPVS
ncbi:DUF397 domain-containing protein [Kitasatospora cineracea]|uniref:DUF397 domain-containing protein n=1 Tax=Kitasatospora cineracea TaxID=88074 RepID=UPI0033E7CD88